MPQEPTKEFNDQSPASTTGNAVVAKAKDALAEGAGHLKDDVKHAAEEAASQAKELAETKFEAGRDIAAEHLGSVASALRKAGDELRSNDSPVTDYVTKAAGAVDYVSYYLQTRTLSHMMGDLESFSRREPAIFLGGSFLAGLLGGRFLKSATPASRGGTTGRQPPRAVPALPGYSPARNPLQAPARDDGDRDVMPGGVRTDTTPRGTYGSTSAGASKTNTPSTGGYSASRSAPTSGTSPSPSPPSTPSTTAAASTGASTSSTSRSTSTMGSPTTPTAPTVTANGDARNGEAVRHGAR